METILLVDDEQAVLDGQENLLRLNGYNSILKARTAADARGLVAEKEVALAILDLTLTDEAGIDLLRWLRENSRDTVILVVTGASDIKLAVECMRAGAYDFLLKGSDTGRLPGAVRNGLEHRSVVRENERLRNALVSPTLKNPDAFQQFVTRSEQIRRLFYYLEAVAPLPDPLLITGETGVGKEVIARAIHRAAEVDGPFVPVNLGGLDDHILTDTLFGHTKGAFTGAEGIRDGLIKTAAGGTLFLDELGELSQESQTKLLRLLDSGEYFPLGSDRSHIAETRIILATNRNLSEEVEKGRFRQDLYYRVAAHEIRVPPLRERPEDIEAILFHLLSLHSRRLNRPIIEPGEGVLARLKQQPLPGNVRELEQLVLSSLIHRRWTELETESGNGEPREARDGTGTGCADAEVGGERRVVFGGELPTPWEAVEALLKEAVRRYPDNRSEAASAVGLSPQAFANRWRRMMEQGEEERL